MEGSTDISRSSCSQLRVTGTPNLEGFCFLLTHLRNSRGRYSTRLRRKNFVRSGHYFHISNSIILPKE